jgi:hypothetical protein
LVSSTKSYHVPSAPKLSPLNIEQHNIETFTPIMTDNTKTALLSHIERKKERKIWIQGEWKKKKVHHQTICVQYVMETSRIHVKLTVLIGFVLTVLCLFGDTLPAFNLVNVHSVVDPLIFSFQPTTTMILKLCLIFKPITVFLVNNPMLLLLREFLIFPFFWGDFLGILLTLILLFLLLSELVSSLLLVFHNSTFFFFLFKIKSWLLSSWNSIQLIFFYPFFLFFL